MVTYKVLRNDTSKVPLIKVSDTESLNGDTFINPVERKGCDVNWGYECKGSNALAEIIAEEVYGDYNSDEFDTVMNYVLGKDNANDFYVSNIVLNSLLGKQ